MRSTVPIVVTQMIVGDVRHLETVLDGGIAASGLRLEELGPGGPAAWVGDMPAYRRAGTWRLGTLTGGAVIDIAPAGNGWQEVALLLRPPRSRMGRLVWRETVEAAAHDLLAQLRTAVEAARSPAARQAQQAAVQHRPTARAPACQTHA